MRVDVCQTRGQRPEQEDCFWVEENLEGLIMLAVADGYRKGDHSGRELAEKVIGSWKAKVSLGRFRAKLRREFWRVSQEVFALIDAETMFQMAGSTLSAALIDPAARKVYTAILGDSPIIAGDDRHLWVEPDDKLHLSREHLWGAFGDYQNRERHNQNPALCGAHLDSQKACVLVASDGLFPATEAREIRQMGREYLELAQSGASAQSIVEAAERRGSADNATLLLCRL